MSAIANSFHKFLIYLASRRYRENDLSDVTWSVCQVVPAFTAALCECLGCVPSGGGIIEAEREYPLSNGGRPDFCFLTEAPFLVVEVKLNDRNYHFKQYAEGKPSGAHLVLLTNHQLDGPARQEADSLGWSVVGWLDLLLNLSSRDFGDYQSLVNAYLAFAGQLCGARRMEQIRFDNQSLYSIGLMHELLQQILRRYQNPRARVSPYNTSRAFSQTWMGAYYHLEILEHTGREAWLFFGLAYEEPTPFLTISVEKDWNSGLVAILGKHLGQTTADIRVQEYPDRSGVNLKMAHQAFEMFKVSTPLEQERQLASWFATANERLIACI